MHLKSILKYTVVFLISLTVLTGCGDSDDSQPSESTETLIPQSDNVLIENNITEEVTESELVEVTDTDNESESTIIPVSKTKGYLIDAPIYGAMYLCDGEEGLTDSNGTFECIAPPVTFRVGNLLLGTLKAFTVDGKVYPQDLLGLDRENYSDDRLKLLARLLQSLDDDGDIETQITITEELRSKLIEEENFEEMSESEVKALLSEIGKKLVNECGALEHLGDKNIKCNRDGSYVVPTLETFLSYPSYEPIVDNTPSVVDNIPPVITLNGDNPMNVDLGTLYVEPGATAIDDIDGEVPVEINSSELNISSLGSYKILYRAKDSKGNESNKTRVVNVVATVPKVDNLTIDVDENSPVGTTVGTLNVMDGGSSIISITLSGSGSSDFNVSKEGVILVNIGASLDFETKNVYMLKAVATNAIGVSDEANVTISLNDINFKYKVVLHITDKIGGYEAKLKFTKDFPTAKDIEPWKVSLDKTDLEASDRIFTNLGPSFDTSAKVISFGAWSMGSEEGVSGDIEVMTFETEDLASQLSIIDKSFTDKDANSIMGTISIEDN